MESLQGQLGVEKEGLSSLQNVPSLLLMPEIPYLGDGILYTTISTKILKI